MKITFINVGYGEAVLVELKKPEPKSPPYVLMIDGGGNEPEEFTGFPQRIRASDYLKKTGIGRIDLLISTHIHEDHTCGLLNIISETEIGEFWCNYEVPPEFEGYSFEIPANVPRSVSKFLSAVNCYNKIYFNLKRRGVPIRQIYGIQQRVELKYGLFVDILGPSYENYMTLKSQMNDIYSSADKDRKLDMAARTDAWINMASIMLRFSYLGVRVFLPSDVNCSGYGHLKGHRDLLEADIFKAAHHGQIDGISDELAALVHPRVVVTCASSDLRYGSSNRGTYELIEKNLQEPDEKPTFLFSDDVEIAGYSKPIVSHYATEIEIEDKIPRISCKYIQTRVNQI